MSTPPASPRGHHARRGPQNAGSSTGSSWSQFTARKKGRTFGHVGHGRVLGSQGDAFSTPWTPRHTAKSPRSAHPAEGGTSDEPNVPSRPESPPSTGGLNFRSGCPTAKAPRLRGTVRVRIGLGNHIRIFDHPHPRLPPTANSSPFGTNLATNPPEQPHCQISPPSPRALFDTPPPKSTVFFAANA